MDRVIRELCNKGTILQRNYRKMITNLQRNYRKMTIKRNLLILQRNNRKMSFSYNSFVNFILMVIFL